MEQRDHRTESNFSNSSLNDQLGASATSSQSSLNDQLGASTTSSQSYSSHCIRGRRSRREWRRRMHVFRFLQLPVQVTTVSYANQLFNGTPNFF